MNHLLATGRLDFCLASASAAQEPIRFSVTDLDGMDALQREKGPFTEAFKVASGLAPAPARDKAIACLSRGGLADRTLVRIDSLTGNKRQSLPASFTASSLFALEFSPTSGRWRSSFSSALVVAVEQGSG